MSLLKKTFFKRLYKCKNCVLQTQEDWGLSQTGSRVGVVWTITPYW